ncbi:MAG: hypothetical protein IM516_07275 [Pseudanabaena sp. M158S2SP1A06QC]|jgi:hypothetical protein|nr:hypothetical protein [Pseudanabaena sp. M158S2SP1A06QC]MCA6623941.1 hypothetical protein [Pseudanabaena sp. M165S2SP1A06QC]
MAIIGNADLWSNFFPDHLIPDILNMVLDVWNVFKDNCDETLEVPITKRFRSHLEQYKDLKMLPIRLDREAIVDDISTEKEIGRIDLRLTHGYRSEVYFAFECKRLNVIDKNGRTSTLAKEYVMNGMTRFVGSNPQYAIGLKQGGMIGYVMNGKIDGAITAVNKQIKDHYKDLQMKPSKGLNPSSRLPENLIRESLHHLPDRDFTIHHVFLPISTI